VPAGADARSRSSWLRALVLGAALTFAGPALAKGHDAARLHALFDEYWSTVKREFPEYATFLGDDRHDDRLTDLQVSQIGGPQLDFATCAMRRSSITRAPTTC